MIEKVRNLFAPLCFSIFLLVLAGCSGGDSKELTILHWNDLHSANLTKEIIRDGDTTYVGGVANLAGAVAHYRSTRERTLALNAGDDFQGSPISTLTQGQSQIDLLNQIHPDAFTVGNHEFDYGVPSLKEKMSQLPFPVLSCNVAWEKDGSLLFPADTILTVDGIKVGIIGVMTARFKEVTTNKATEGLTILPSAEQVQKSLKRIVPKSDIQIILSHQGINEDSLLALAVGDEIDLIVGAHSHTLLREASLVNGVPIVQAGAKGGWLGIVTMQVDTRRNDVVSFDYRVDRIVEGAYPADEKVAEIVAAQEAELAMEMDKVVATLKKPWRRSYKGESNIGNWITDAFREQTDSDLAFVNNGGIRSNVDVGPLQVREIFEVAPFGNELMRFALTGADVKKFVLHQGGGGSFLQVSGMRYHVRNGKILSLTVGGRPVKDSDTYKAVTLNYVTDHFERFFGLDPTTHPLTPLYIVDRDALIAYAEAHKEIDSRIEQRVTID